MFIITLTSQNSLLSSMSRLKQIWNELFTRLAKNLVTLKESIMWHVSSFTKSLPLALNVILLADTIIMSNTTKNIPVETKMTLKYIWK